MQPLFLIILTIATDPKMTKHLLSWLITLIALSCWAQSPQLELPRVQLQTGMYQIDAQVASTPEQRAIGLMYRRDMPQHEGMLFVFEQPQVQCFWMKNTLMPLTAAFIADDGRIVNLADMQAQTTDSHCSEKPVRYVLEMKQGWFASKHIRKGQQLKSSVFNNLGTK
jgi:uncharacterized membrane protein (UPF0127 family)